MEGQRTGKFAAFSLLECILACFLFATVALGLTFLWPTLNQGTVRSRHRLVAVHIAQLMLERYATQARASAALAPSTGVYKVSSTSNSVTIDTEYHYDITTTSMGLGLTDVVVKVRWDQQGVSQEVTQEVVLRSSG